MGAQTAVIYLVTSGIALAVFMFCSFWVYHYVDLEDDLEEFSGQNAELSLKDYRHTRDLDRDSRKPGRRNSKSRLSLSALPRSS